MSTTAETTNTAPGAETAASRRRPQPPSPVVPVRLRVWQRVPAHWAYVLGLYLGVKVLFTLVGLLVLIAYDPVATVVAPSDQITGVETGRRALSPFRSLSMWFAWDSFIYYRVGGPDFTGPWENFAFPLLYPALSRMFSLVLGGDLALGMLLVSNLAFVGVLYYSHRLGGLLLGDEAGARRFTRYVVLLPTAFLFQAALTESLFLCLLLACFYYAERRRWLLVGVVGFFLALSRSVGFLLALPLGLILLQQYRYRLNRQAIVDYLRSGWPLLLIPAGWLAFMAFCRWQGGDWFAYKRAQETGWGISVQNPFGTVWKGLTMYPPDSARVWLAVIALVIIAVGAFMGLRLPYVVCALLLVLVPLSIGPPVYKSLLRYLAVVFPLALVFARWGSRRSVDTFLTAALALVQGALFVVWLTYWTNFII